MVTLGSCSGKPNRGTELPVRHGLVFQGRVTETGRQSVDALISGCWSGGMSVHSPVSGKSWVVH